MVSPMSPNTCYLCLQSIQSSDNQCPMLALAFSSHDFLFCFRVFRGYLLADNFQHLHQVRDSVNHVVGTCLFELLANWR
jgi:predicted amidophosphoribosyltransferase